MVRVRVKALNFYIVESGPPKKPGRAATRRARKIPQGSEISVSADFYEQHKDALQLLGEDKAAKTGAKTPASTPTELENLRAEAADLGIDVDKRWREGRLKDEIAAKRAELEDEDEDPDPDSDADETEDENAGDAE